MFVTRKVAGLVLDSRHAQEGDGFCHTWHKTTKIENALCEVRPSFSLNAEVEEGRCWNVSVKHVKHHWMTSSCLHPWSLLDFVAVSVCVSPIFFTGLAWAQRRCMCAWAVASQQDIRAIRTSVDLWLVASTPLVEELQLVSRMNKKQQGRHKNLYEEPQLSRKCTANLLPCGSARIFDLCNANKFWIGMANSAVGMLEACQWQNMRGYQREVKLPTCENR